MNKPDYNKILSTIDTFVQDEQPFSAYDITKTLRHDGFVVRHQEVKDVVTQSFSMPWNYTKTLHPTLQAWIYHPDVLEVDDYDPIAVPDFVLPNQPIRTINTTKNQTQSAPKVRSLFDKRGRYSVPAVIVRQANLTPGSVVTIETQDDKIIVSTGGSNVTRLATVDCYYNIRIPKKDFESAFDGVPQKIQVIINSGVIEISV